jgi:uncharacterized protein YfaQ (DUF2300 family)
MNDVTAQAYLQAAAALFNTFAFDKVIPLVALVAMLSIFAWLFAKAQQKDSFNLQEMFQDETGKVSAARTIAFMAFSISSWDLMAARLSNAADPQQYAYYLFAWSGALVFVKFADRWDGSMPFGKGGAGKTEAGKPKV